MLQIAQSKAWITCLSLTYTAHHKKGIWPLPNPFLPFCQVEHTMKAINCNFEIVSYWFLFVKQTTKCSSEGNNLRYMNEKSLCSCKGFLSNMAKFCDLCNGLLCVYFCAILEVLFRLFLKKMPSLKREEDAICYSRCQSILHVG